MIYLTSTNKQAIIDAEAKISRNCGFPNDSGTLCWDVPTKAINQTLWFIERPNSYNNLTAEVMLNGVDMGEIEEAEFNSSWFPLEEGEK